MHVAHGRSRVRLQGVSSACAQPPSLLSALSCLTYCLVSLHQMKARTGTSDELNGTMPTLFDTMSSTRLKAGAKLRMRSCEKPLHPTPNRNAGTRLQDEALQQVSQKQGTSYFREIFEALQTRLEIEVESSLPEIELAVRHPLSSARPEAPWTSTATAKSTDLMSSAIKLPRELAASRTQSRPGLLEHQRCLNPKL